MEANWMLVPELPFLHLQVAQASALLYHACIYQRDKKIYKKNKERQNDEKHHAITKQ